MKKLFFAIVLIAFSANLLKAQDGYNVGDKASDFSLKNVDGKMVSLSDFSSAKGFIVVFTCNHCPYSIAYEDRIIELDKEFAPKGFPVIAINPNDTIIVPDDSFTAMQVRAKEKGFTFPYLMDDNQKYTKLYGAKKTPHVFVLERSGKKFKVAYIGAIDDNSNDASAATQHYVKQAVNALLDNKKPDPATTKAVGCSVKMNKTK